MKDFKPSSLTNLGVQVRASIKQAVISIQSKQGDIRKTKEAVIHMETSSQKLIRPSAQERSLFLQQYQILLSPKKCLTMAPMETRRTAWALEAVKPSTPLIFIVEVLLQLDQTPNFKVQ
jgi:endonuclease/exonuclease/phosphatase family metal-dependent hydrolase